MINQKQVSDIVIKELRDFNLSLGWIDPDLCFDYDEYESNEGGIYYEIDEYFSIRFEKRGYFDTTSEEQSMGLLDEVNLVVEQHEPYEDWINYQYHFKLPNMMCLSSIESFTEAFKESVVHNHKERRLEALRDKIRLPHVGEDKLLEMEGAEYVDIRLYLSGWDYEILNIHK